MNAYLTLPHYLTAENFYEETKKYLNEISDAGTSLVLLTLDFDNFNYINDLFSYEVGDLVLEKITARFSSLLSDGEYFSKIHADHFTFCLKGRAPSGINRFFLHMTDFTEDLEGILPPHYRIAASGGGVVVPDNSLPLSALLDKANFARKASKGNNINSFRFFDQKMADIIQWQKNVTLTMESALKRREFEMYLQPKILIQSDQIAGAEALVRWNSPSHGLIYPDRFIPILEQNGFIRQIDFYMLEEACRFLKKCEEKQQLQLPISVNFSRAHLRTEGLVESILHIVQKVGISPHLIEIEFTESLSTEDFEKLSEIVNDLKQLGFQVSLDDFGSAYSSLNCLKELDFDIIKIDKGFLNHSENSDKGKVIVANIIELIKSLKMRSVMEGIEEAEQIEFLKKLDCDLGQGYFYAKPMPVAEYEEYLRHGSIIGELKCKMTELEQNETQKCSLENKIRDLETLVEEERKTKESLRLSEERYRIIIEQSNDIVFDWDFEAGSIYFSDKYWDFFGIEPLTQGIMTNARIRERIHPDDRTTFEQWLKNVYGSADCTVSEYRIKNQYNQYIWMRCRSTGICNDSGKAIRAIGTFSDIHAEKTKINTLTMKSQRDSLTKLLNKEETQKQIEELLQANPGQTGAFFIVDIDNFKGVNDNLGHQLGDTILLDLAHKVQEVFPQNSIIGRIGGDEIAVFLLHPRDSEIHAKAEQLTRTLRSSYYGSSTKYNISVSVGISCYPADGKSFSELYHLADIALYESKNKGKDRFTFYHSDMTGSLQDNRTPVEWSECFLNTYFQEDFPFKVFEMLYETKDISASIRRILELMGKQFLVDRVYIFQNDAQNESISNTYEWCAEGITPEKDNLQNLPLSQLSAYLAHYSPEGVFYCTDIGQTDEAVYRLCAPQGIKSLLHCALYNEGERVGFIGFDFCRTCHVWTGEEIAILGYISRILSIFMIKTKTADDLRVSYQNYMEMLDNLNGFVYVVDPLTHETLYINNATRGAGFETGRTCYKMAYGSDTPCPQCPIHRLTDDKPYATEEIYSELLDVWVNSAASKLKWEGVRDAVLICCTDISKYKK